MPIRNISSYQFEKFAKSYPAIFEKCRIDSFDVGQGWYPIIETLLQLITADLDNAITKLAYAKEQDYSSTTKALTQETIDKWQSCVDELKEQIPVIMNVKEKFGSLCIYIENTTPAVNNYIEFAESLSLHTCEQCGSFGEPRSDGWVKTLCDRHHKEREIDSDLDNA